MNKYLKIVCLTLSMGMGFGLSNIAKADGHSVMFASWGGSFQDALRTTMLTPAAEKLGIETIFDDRDESAGKKFSDGDLIGVPFQLIIGPRELKNGNVELKIRKTNKKEITSFERAIDKIKSIIFEE